MKTATKTSMILVVLTAALALMAAPAMAAGGGYIVFQGQDEGGPVLSGDVEINGGFLENAGVLTQGNDSADSASGGDDESGLQAAEPPYGDPAAAGEPQHEDRRQGYSNQNQAENHVVPPQRGEPQNPVTPPATDKPKGSALPNTGTQLAVFGAAGLMVAAGASLLRRKTSTA